MEAEACNGSEYAENFGVSTVTRITVADYDRMIAEGYFPLGPKRHRVELIDGELRQISPIGPLHEEIVDILNEWSMTNVPRKNVRVRIQNSIGVPAPEPLPNPTSPGSNGKATVREGRAATTFF